MALRECFIRRTRYCTLMGNHQMDKQLHTRRKPQPKLTFQHQCVLLLNKQKAKNRQIWRQLASFHLQTSKVEKEINSVICHIQLRLQLLKKKIKMLGGRPQQTQWQSLKQKFKEELYLLQHKLQLKNGENVYIISESKFHLLIFNTRNSTSFSSIHLPPVGTRNLFLFNSFISSFLFQSLEF